MCHVSSGVLRSKYVCLITIPHICGCDLLPMGFENEAGHSIRQKASEFQRGKDGDTQVFPTLERIMVRIFAPCILGCRVFRMRTVFQDSLTWNHHCLFILFLP